MKKLLLICVISFCLVFLTACEEDEAEKIARIDTFESEVEYGYCALDQSELTINFNNYEYKDLACQFVKDEYGDYVYKTVIEGDYAYFLYQYKIYRNIFNRNDVLIPSDVALFRVNLFTAKCELLYDFKRVYPLKKYHIVNIETYRFVDENTLIFQYNGKIQIFDISKKEVIYSIEAYDYEEARNSKDFSEIFNDFNDFIIKDIGVVYYYEFVGNEFILHQYERSEEKWWLARVEDYVYIQAGYNNYLDCFDIKTGERVDIDTLEAKLEEDRIRRLEEAKYRYIFTINKVNYFYNNSDDYLTIYDENHNQIAKIDEIYMKENSQAFNDLYSMWDERVSRYVFSGLIVDDNKVFIKCYSKYDWMRYTPIYIYEYDMVNGNIYYVGYTLSGGACIKVTEK
ncbi:MAG: hypothetical protein PHT83_00700 [Bacilli bacterium]|nr:hypothetical protein [Bacilli bacterium]